MPDALMIAVGTTLVTALLSVVTTYVAMITKTRRDLEAQYDKDLLERRLKAYAPLWALSEPLARYSPAEALSPRGARSLSERLRRWYFRHGMVLSGDARGAYFDLQRRLTAEPVAAAATAAADPLDRAIVEVLQDASRALHAALCADVGARRPPMIGDKYRDRETPRWWAVKSGRTPR
jgi:hypothetical protein